MALVILGLLIAVPLVEIYLFIQLGGWIGAWQTVGVVVLTALVGGWLLRLQGLDVLRRVQASMQRNEAPVAELFDGACLLVGGALLLTPGFLTDGVGFLLLLPPVRVMLRAYFATRMSVRMRRGAATGGFRNVHSGNAGPGNASPGNAGGPVIDGEYRDISDDPRDTPASTRGEDRPGGERP